MKKINLRFLVSVLLCMTVLVSVSACGNNNNSKETTSTTSSSTAKTSIIGTKKDPVTLTFSTFNAWWTNGAIQKAIEMYQDETGNKVDPQIFPDDQFKNVISTKLASGDTPDVFAIWPIISQFNIGLLEPLDGSWTSKINADRAKKMEYSSLKDGKFYTAPYGAVSLQGIMYNKEVFKSAGITPPLKTYDDFLAACEAIKKLGITPLTLPSKEGWTTQIVFYAGSAYIPAKDSQFGANIASNKVKPSQVPEIIDLFNRVLAVKDKGYTNEDYLSTTMAMAEQALAEGKTAMVFGGAWLYSDFNNNYKDKVESIGMTACNWGDDAADLSIVMRRSGNGLYVPVASKHKTEAKEFVNFVMSDKVMQAMYEISPGINEIGVKTKASDWDIKMKGYVDAGTAKINDDIINSTLVAFPGSGFDVGDFSATCRSIWEGKDLKKGLDDWYEEYAKVNKAKKVSGF